MENARVLIVGDPPSPALLDSLPASVKAVALRRMADVRAVMKETPWPRRAFLHWSFLDRPVICSLEDLRRQGVIVPITIYLDSPTRDAYARAWLAAGPLRASLVQPPDLGRQVAPQEVADVIALVGLTSPLASERKALRIVSAVVLVAAVAMLSLC